MQNASKFNGCSEKLVREVDSYFNRHATKYYVSYTTIYSKSSLYQSRRARRDATLSP